jgi:hypothetical protein
MRLLQLKRAMSWMPRARNVIQLSLTLKFDSVVLHQGANFYLVRRRLAQEGLAIFRPIRADLATAAVLLVCFAAYGADHDKRVGFVF